MTPIKVNSLSISRVLARLLLIPFKKLISLTLRPVLHIDRIFSTSHNQVFSFEINRKRVSESENIIIYVTYAKNSLIGLTENESIRKLNGIKNSCLIVVVNTSSSQIFSIENCSGFAYRQNRGRDLAAFRDILEVLDDSIEDKNIVYLNSSCWWNPKRIETFLALGSSTNVVFLTDSLQGGYHLQSYFMFFPKDKQDLLRELSALFKNFRLKRTVVNYGEKRIHKFFAKVEQVDVLFSVKGLTGISRFVLNPSIEFGRRYYSSGAPGVKKRALAKK